jgi:hypothetical protein
MKTTQRTTRRKTSVPALPFSQKFVDDFSALPVDAQVATLRLIALHFDLRDRSAAAYCVTDEQRAADRAFEAKWEMARR